MNKSLLIAAVCAGLPACAALAGPPANVPVDCAAKDYPPPADGALPARAGVAPAPERGTVAPSASVPSHVKTPSMRAMEKVNAAREAQGADVDKKTQAGCANADDQGAPPQGTSRPAKR